MFQKRMIFALCNWIVVIVLHRKAVDGATRVVSLVIPVLRIILLFRVLCGCTDLIHVNQWSAYPTQAVLFAQSKKIAVGARTPCLAKLLASLVLQLSETLIV